MNTKPASKPKTFSVRASPHTMALFDQLHEQVNRSLPIGSVSKQALLEMVVTSASAAFAAGQLHAAIPAPREKSNQT